MLRELESTVVWHFNNIYAECKNKRTIKMGRHEIATSKYSRPLHTLSIKKVASINEYVKKTKVYSVPFTICSNKNHIFKI